MILIGWVLWHINLVSYFMPNPVYAYMIGKHILFITFYNEPKVLLYTQLNSFKYFNLARIILFTINHLFAQS